MNCLTVDFFLGANAESGFISHFEQLQNPETGYHTYIIKGSAGSGKSTLMKRVAADCHDSGLCEQIHCSSDPASLDAVILHDKKTAVLDGTPPHVMEPKHPGVCETIVSMYEAFNKEKLLEKKDELVHATSVTSCFHRRFCGLLKCANLLLDGNIGIIAPYINYKKMDKTVHNIAKKEFREESTGTGNRQVRLLSAFTPDGLVTYQDTVKKLCSKIYLLGDEYQVCCDAFLTRMEEEARRRGYDVYVCYSPFHAEGRIEHLIIPELSLGFVTRSRFVTLDEIQPDKVINATRFYEREILKLKKQRLSFCKKTAAELIREGTSILNKAKQTHDLLEQYYAGAVDYQVIDHISNQLIHELS